MSTISAIPTPLVVKIFKDKLAISGTDVQWDANSNMGDKYDEEIDWYQNCDPGIGWQFSRISLLLDVVDSGGGGGAAGREAFSKSLC